jgi:TonB family protein
MAKAGSNKPKNPSRRNFGILPNYGKINQRNRKGLPLPDMKNFLFTLVTVAGFSLGAVAQDTIRNEHTASPQILTYAEQMPEPTINVPKFLAKNLHYPKAARNENVQGKVVLRFIVDTVGNVSDITVVKSVHPLLDSESVRVVKLLDQWKPGMQNGKAVNVYYTLPIVFKLDEHELMELAKPGNGDLFQYVEKVPKAPFDVDSFINANLRFPEPEKSNGIDGIVLVKIQINEDGSVSKPMIAGSVYATLDEEAMRVLKLMPPWEPALIDNKPVAVFMPVKVQFKKDDQELADALKSGVRNMVDLQQMPEPGFDINEFLGNNLKYPKEARMFNIEGKEYVRFVIDEEGNVTSVCTPHPVNVFLDMEARRVVEAMPKWKKPGKVNNQPVKVYYTLPIVFRIEH